MSDEMKLDLVLKELAELKEAISALSPITEEGLTLEQAMSLARIKSKSAWYRFTFKTNLHAYVRGLYRTADVKNAMARAALGQIRRKAA